MNAMRYVKQKREKVGLCTICKRFRDLTYDHIPPTTAGNVNPVMLVSAMSAISGRPQEDLPLIKPTHHILGLMILAAFVSGSITSGQQTSQKEPTIQVSS
jgi:hypothetical protein